MLVVYRSSIVTYGRTSNMRQVTARKVAQMSSRLDNKKDEIPLILTPTKLLKIGTTPPLLPKHSIQFIIRGH